MLACLSLRRLSYSESVTQGCCQGLSEDNRSDTTLANDTTVTPFPVVQPKPSKFDENIEDTIPVDIGENGTLIPDYNAKDKVGTVVFKDDDKGSPDEEEDPPPQGSKSNIVLRKKIRGQKKILDGIIEERVTNVNVLPENVSDKDMNGDYGTRIEKRTSNLSSNTTTDIVGPVIVKRRIKRPKRSPMQFYEDVHYRVPINLYPHRQLQPYGANKHRRYVRFPLADLPPSGPASAAGFRPNRLLWGSDSIVPRSPRLVFRDPVEPGTLHAPFFSSGSNLQDISASEENTGKHLRIICSARIMYLLK